MAILFSKNNMGFFVQGVLPEDPEDGIEVSQEDYDFIMSELNKGKVLSTNAKNNPIAVEPKFTNKELKDGVSNIKQMLLSSASLSIAPLQDAVDLGSATEDQISLLKEWKEYRISLGKVESQEGYPSKVEWPSTPK